MSQRDLAQDDPLADFTALHMTIEGVEKRVWVAGDGLGVIVMAEMPGISPHVARFARWVRDAGFRVYMPSLFGRELAIALLISGYVLVFAQLRNSPRQAILISSPYGAAAAIIGASLIGDPVFWPFVALAPFTAAPRSHASLGVLGVPSPHTPPLLPATVWQVRLQRLQVA